MSNLVERISLALAASTDSVERAELAARMACYFARIGRFDSAKELIRQLRIDFGDGKSGRATIWIMIAEALVHLYSDLNPQALDRVTRAQALALAMGYRPGISIASAWKAHLEFEVSAFDAMIQSIRMAHDAATPDNEDALTRLSIVLSNSFMLCGDRAQAQAWFIRGRELAVRTGDQASIEALLYNRTAFGVAHTRAQLYLGEEVLEDISLMRREVESSKNLQRLTSAAALTNHIELWSARLSIMQRKYADAEIELNKVRGCGPFAEYNFNHQMIDLELIYCAANLGRLEEAAERFRVLTFEFASDLDLDEQLAIAWMRQRLSRMHHTFDDANERSAALEEISAAFVGSRLTLLQKLKPWCRDDSVSSSIR